MTKKEIITRLYEQFDRKVTWETVTALVTAYEEALFMALINDEEAPLTGIGKLVAYKRKARKSWDGINNRPVAVPENISVKFKPSQVLKRALNS